MDPRFLDLGISWRWVVSFTSRPLYPRYPLNKRLGGPQSWSGRHGEVRILAPTGTRTPNPWSSSPYPVAIPAVFSSCSVSNIDLCVWTCMSFVSNICNYICGIYLMCLNFFFCVFIMSIVLVIFPYAYPALSMWFEYPELLLLFLISCICSLYLVCEIRPVCPTYFCGKSMHFIW
jgi:hypothetical protein